MNIRIAILAACTSTLVLAQANPAQAQNYNRDHIDQDAQFREENRLAKPKATTGANGLTKRSAPRTPVNGWGGQGGGRLKVINNSETEAMTIERNQRRQMNKAK